MNSRQGVLQVLRHQLPDRVPVYEVLIDSPMVAQVLGIPGRNSWELPIAETVALHLKLGLDAVIFPLPCWRPAELRNTRINPWKLTVPSTGMVEDAIARCDQLVNAAHAEGLAACAYCHGCFDVVYESLGFDHFMLMLYDDFAYVDEVTACLHTFHMGVTALALQTGIDWFLIGDDICFKSGLFIRPDMFYQLWFDREKAQATLVKTSGRPLEYHTDGALDPVLPYLLDLGVDLVNPVEPYSNDIFALKRQYGDRIAFRGNVDIAGALAFGSPDAVYEETKNLVLNLKPGGNYVCSSSHSISSAITERENYAALVCAVEDYGWY